MKADLKTYRDGKSKAVVVFFNKVDLLEEKLRKGADVLKYIPELDQPKHQSAKFHEPLPSEDSPELNQILAARYCPTCHVSCPYMKPDLQFLPYRKSAVIDHFREKFHNIHVQGDSRKNHSKDDNFHSFETCATDTESIRNIEYALNEKLFKELIKGLMI